MHKQPQSFDQKLFTNVLVVLFFLLLGIYNCKYYLSKDTITNTKINVCHKYLFT